MAASAWLATSEHKSKVDGLKEELRRQHGSPCLAVLDQALQHCQRVRRCFCVKCLLCWRSSVVLERQKTQ